MTRVRQWSLGTAVLFLLILLGSWFLLVSPKKSEAADLQAQTATQISQNEQLRAKLVTLQEQSTHLADQQARLAAIRQHLPANLALAAYIRSKSAAADASNVSLDSMAPTEPGAVVATTTNGTAAVSPAGQLMAVKVDLKATGTYFDLEQFVNKLEAQQRSVLVIGFTMNPAAEDTTTAAASAAPATGPAKVSIDLQLRMYYSPPYTAPVVTTPAASPAASTATN